MELLRPNLLIISELIPYPLDEGGRISQFAIIDYLRREFNICLIAVIHNTEHKQAVSTLQGFWPDVEFQVINMMPEPIQASRPGFAEQLKHIARRLFRLIRKSASSNQNLVVDPYDEFEKPWLINLVEPKSKKFIQQLDKIVRGRKIDLVQIDFISYADLLGYFRGDYRRVLVHHEIRSARLETWLASKNKLPDAYENYVLDYVQNEEVNLLMKADAIVCFSPEDKVKLEEMLPGYDIMVSAFPVLDQDIREISEANTEISKLSFVGGEGHYPNKDAVDWLIRDILPVIRKKKNFELHIAGQWTAETIATYSHLPYVKFHGFVHDLFAFSINSIHLAPIRIGSGIRTKILYAMAQGIPVVATSLGAEGISVTNGTSILIADTPEQYADAVYRLSTDTAFSQAMIRKAQLIVKNLYSQSYASKERATHYRRLLGISYAHA